MATAYEKAVNFWQRITTVLSPKTAGDSLLLDLASGSYFNIRYPWAVTNYEIFKIVAGAHPGTLQISGEMIYELNLHANGLATTNFPYIRWQQGLGGPPDILFEITASHPVTPSSAELRLTGGILSLKDSYLVTAINLSQTGTTGLVGFTALSLIAALNELMSGKEPTLIKGNLTAGSTKISIGGTGTNALMGAGASVDVNEGNLTLSNLGGTVPITKGGTGLTSAPAENEFLIGKADGTYEQDTLAPGFAAAFFIEGAATLDDDIIQVLIPRDCEIELVKVYSTVAPTGTTLIVDVYKNGVTIFTDPSKRPEVAINEFAADSDVPDVVSLSAGDRIRVGISQIGSGVAGGDPLLVTVLLKR